MPRVDDARREVVGAALGSPVASVAVQGGGDTARAYRVELADGRSVFAKTRSDAPAGVFATEAAGLRWLRDGLGAGRAGGVDIGVPDVLGVGDDPAFLALEWIEPGRSGATTEADLGRGLVALHGSGAPGFGRVDRRPTGSRNLPNEPFATWPEAYAANRLQPLARIARDERALPAAAVADLEQVADRLDRAGAADEPPARVHGDLWAGNRLVGAGGRNWLIDPAAHGGHREFDLAMMRLFGGFGPDAFAAYDEVHPLADGWAERVPLHQLAPLVVHAIKFGGSYVPASVDAIARSLRLLA